MSKRIIAVLASFSLFIYYFYLLYQRIRPFYLHPGWTTDDALQQTFPFWEAVYPDLFKGDLIAEVMKGSNGPVHLRLGMFITRFTQNPVMTAHILGTIQLFITLTALFFAVRRVSSSAAAFFAITWLLHTATVVQRITGGLARGWFPAVIAVFLWLFLSKKHKGVLLFLVLGCLLHPPAALVCCTTYSLYLLYLFFKERKYAKKMILQFAFMCPIYLIAVLIFVHRPAYVGNMVSYSQASKMPDFQVYKGRFPYLPLRTIPQEIKTFAFE
ncbi:MAG: hypothetical protein D6780_05190, partial [Candidatus Dadabacteria bacterium]